MIQATNTAADIVNAATNELRGIKPPVYIPSGWALLWWSLGALVLIGAGLWAWRYWRKLATQLPVTQPVPPHITARRRLEEALALIAQPREFCILVSDTIRWYLEERFDFRAPERTTEEFLYELQNTNLLNTEQKESLGEFLQRCDLVKFAKYEPAQPELRDLHSSALRLVSETEPLSTPAPANPVPEPLKAQPPATIAP